MNQRLVRSLAFTGSTRGQRRLGELAMVGETVVARGLRAGRRTQQALERMSGGAVLIALVAYAAITGSAYIRRGRG